MQTVRDTYFKAVVVDIINSCHGSLIQNLVGESKYDIFALLRFLENHVSQNRKLVEVSKKCAAELLRLKCYSGNSWRMAQVCTRSLHDIYDLGV
jgi:hypothetical protein